MKYGVAMIFIHIILFLSSCESNSAPEAEWGAPVPLTVQELSLEGEVLTRVTAGSVTTDGATISVSQLAYGGFLSAYTCSG